MRLVDALGSDPRYEGPERPAPGDREQRGQDRQHRDHREADAQGADRAQARGAGDLGEGQGQQGGHDRQPGGDDRGSRLSHRDLNRLVLVLMAPELLAITGDQQQRIIRARAEHEDGQDASRLAGDCHPGLGQQVAHAAGGDLGEYHREEGDQPEDRAAVDDDQQDQDKQGGRVQQRAVDLTEHVDGVGREPGRARDLRLQPLGKALEVGLDVVGCVHQQLAGFVGAVLDGDRRDQQRRRAVVGDDRCAGLAHAFEALGVDLGPGLRDGRPVLGAQTVVAVEDRDRVGDVARGELLQLLDRLDGLRLGGQVVGWIVLLGVLELARQGPHREQDHQPHGQQRPLRAPSTRQLGEPSAYGPDALHRLLRLGAGRAQG